MRAETKRVASRRLQNLFGSRPPNRKEVVKEVRRRLHLGKDGVRSQRTYLRGANVYRASGIGISIVMIAAGAVLAWAVTAEASGVDLNTVGLILFFVGIAGLVISLLVSMTPSRVRDTTVVDRSLAERPVVERERVEY